MSPSLTLNRTPTKLKETQSHIDTSLSLLLRAHKSGTSTYHKTLDVLARCITDRKSATDPIHVQQLQVIENKTTAILKGLEDIRVGIMETVQDLRIVNAATQNALKKIKRVERKRKGGRGCAEICED